MTVVSPHTTSTRCDRAAELRAERVGASGFGVAAAVRNVLRRRRRGASLPSALPGDDR